MEKITDLNYLQEIAQGDDVFIREIIHTFIRQVPEFAENMRTHLHEKEYNLLAKEAHTAKSSVIIFGLHDLGKRLKELQLMALTGKDSDSYSEYISEFETVCQKAIKELIIH